VPELIGMLKKGDLREQHEAVNILKEIGLSASNALPALGGILRGNNPYLRVVAADAIRHINPSGTEEMLQVYREALRSKNKAVQMAATGSLWEATRQPELVIPALTRMLGDPVSGTFACTILKQCGPNASNAVPALLLQLAAPSLELRVAAAAALTCVDPHAETRTVEATLAAGKAAGLWIYGLEYDAAGH
jgi:HEAT repeat protein